MTPQQWSPYEEACRLGTTISQAHNRLLQEGRAFLWEGRQLLLNAARDLASLAEKCARLPA